MKIQKNRRVVSLGPWPGGLNIRDSEWDIADNELSYSMNVDIDDSGKIEQRPPIFHSLAADWGSAKNYKTGCITPTDMVWCIRDVSDGYVETRTRPVGITSSAWTVYQSPNTAGWRSATAAVFYKEYMYFPLLITSPGVMKIGKVKLSEINTALMVPTWTLLNGPTVNSSRDNNPVVIHNDRLFYADYFPTANRVYYSKPTDFSIWADPDGGQFDVGESAEPINKLVSLNNRIYIFKSGSIWTLDYTNDPVDDGTLQKIVEGVGANDAIAYKNRIFGCNTSGVFELVGGQVYWLSDKLGLRERLNRNAVFVDGSVNEYLSDNLGAPKSMCAIDDKLYVVGWEYISANNPLNNKINPILVLNLANGAWTMYGLDRVEPGETTKCRAQAPLYANEALGTIHGHAFSTDAPYVITTRNGTTDQGVNGVNGPPFARFSTKYYEFNAMMRLKRLFRGFFRIQNFWWDQVANTMSFGITAYTSGLGITPSAILGKVINLNTDTDRALVSDGVWHSVRSRFQRVLIDVQVNIFELSNSNTFASASYHWEIPDIQLEIDDRAEVPRHIPSSAAASG